MNTLYYGDNLDILQRYIKDESVDLVYLDPPFNSNANYNVLFAQKDGKQSSAQIQAFEDTWQWDEIAIHTYTNEVEKGGAIADALRAFYLILGDSNMMAYLTMMAPRLKELHRVLKSTGSLYLHCDPTASHYLKVLLDMVFGAENYINEIIWERSQTRSSISKALTRAHDTIYFYAKSKDYKYNLQFRDLSEASLALYNNEDEKGKYQAVPLLVSGTRNGTTGEVWRGIDPNSRGRAGMHWVTTPSNLDEYEKQGLIIWPEKDGGTPRLKYYLEQSPGVPMNDIWDDIPLISSSSKESWGYPTQKPRALLDRIIKASSDAGDIVLDPFCGCGTAISSAEYLNRGWIGIDITHLAIGLIKRRIEGDFGPDLIYEVIGEPTTVDGARTLAEQDKYQFQWWALGLVGARPADQKKGADRGIDGRLFFHDGKATETKQVILSVKGGQHMNVSHIRDLIGVLDREKADIGVYICLEEPTKPMRQEAAGAGFYHSEVWNRDYPRVQILTIPELLNGKQIDMPPIQQVNQTFKRARRLKKHEGDQMGLDL